MSNRHYPDMWETAERIDELLDEMRGMANPTVHLTSGLGDDWDELANMTAELGLRRVQREWVRLAHSVPSVLVVVNDELEAGDVSTAALRVVPSCDD